MVNYREDLMDAVFTALADSTRRGMIARLSKGPATIGELGRPFAITKPAVTKHVKVLERAGLIAREKDGRVHRCKLNPAPMERAEGWIEKHRKFWETSLGNLARYLEQTKTAGEKE
jgi:DNA-binding transcriptional ArsR family regulator